MNLISILSAVVALVCALIAIYALRSCGRLHWEMTRALASVSSLRGTVEAQSSQLDGLADQLRALRGKFYAERKRAPEASSSDSPFDTPPTTPADLKAQLRRQVGLVPGR